jgi:hypothetical protein
MRSRRRRRSGIEAKQSDENQGVKKPQLAQDHPQVVAGAAQHRVHCIAQRALEPISAELAVGLHVSDGWLDRTAPPDRRTQASRDAASQARVIDLHTVNCYSLVAAIDNGDLRLNVAQDRRLLQCFGQRVPVVRIARHRARADHQTFLVRRGDRHLDAEFVRLARFAFRLSFDFRCVQRVQLVFVLLLLRENALRAANQLFERRSTLLSDAIQLALDVAHHASHSRTQSAQRLLHPLVLFRMRVAPDLAHQTRRFAVVVLPQLQPVLGSSLHRMFPATLEQARIGGMRNRLLHDRRIDDYPLRARRLDDVRSFGRLDGLGQQFFDTSLAQPLAPARQARRINRRLRLQVRLAGEHLPVRVLKPLPNDPLLANPTTPFRPHSPTAYASHDCSDPTIKVATFFEVADYNKLVGRIRPDAWVDAKSPEVLQGLLDATDAVSFVLSSKLSPEDSKIVNEAAENLAAVRWAQQRNRAGVIQGLDGAVHSVDAEEFLAQLQDVNCVVRAGVKPFFTTVPDLELPAIGKRLVLAVLPTTTVAS